LEQKCGFLVHLQRTYPSITPFLKGIHLTLDSWCPGRDADGWKVGGHEPDFANILFSSQHQHAPPAQVKAVPCLHSDLEALSSLFAAPHPPTRYICTTHILVALYRFGDASGCGLEAPLSYQITVFSSAMRCGPMAERGQHPTT